MTIRIAILLCALDFESFFGGILNLSRDQYLRSYRNDWSFVYAQALGSRDISTVIYTPTRENGELYPIDEALAVRFIPLAKWFSLWRRVPFLSRTPPTRYIKEVVNSIAFLPQLQETLRIDGIDVLCIQEYWTGRFDYISHRVRKPIVGIDQGGRPGREIKWFKTANFSRASRLICQSLDETEAVHSFGGRGVFLPNGIDTNFFSPEEPDVRRPWVLTVARLTDRQKRTSDLIRALTLLPESWKLKIAGVGPDEKMLRKLAQSLHVGNRVEFLGYIRERPALRELYRQCGVFALPSANEGLALAALEAMSCGSSCVVSDIRAFKGVIQHQRTGHIVPVGDIVAIAAAIEKAWSCREVIGRSARAAAMQGYSHAAMGDRLSSVLRDAVER